VYRLHLDLDCTGRLHVEVELYNPSLICKDTRGNLNREDARQVNTILSFWGRSGDRGRGTVTHGVCRSNVLVNHGGIIIDSTMIVPWEKHPQSMPRVCRRFILKCVTKNHLSSTICNELIALYVNVYYVNSHTSKHKYVSRTPFVPTSKLFAFQLKL
jgi:hypothetical protein